MGMCYYEQISDVGRDQEMTQKALETFNELVRAGSPRATTAATRS